MNAANTKNKVDYLFHFPCPLFTLAILFPSNSLYHLYVISHTYKGFTIYSFLVMLQCSEVSEAVSEDVGV